MDTSDEKEIINVNETELTEEEEQRRLYLERKVERSFYEAGIALMELRNRRLYRSSHTTFENYCRDRFGYGRRQPYLLMDAVTIVDNLSEKYDLVDHILPTSEYQIRSLGKLEPDEQREAWESAIQEAGGKAPSGRIVKDVVQRIMERTKVPNPFSKGEVCRFIPKDNPELKGKGVCWCIVSSVHEFSCTVVAWDSDFTIRIDHLKSLEYSEEECIAMQELLTRITELSKNKNLEPAARKFLKHLGETRPPHLSPLEEKFLALIEQQYSNLQSES